MSASRSYTPDPALVVESDVPGGDTTRQMRREAEAGFRSAAIDIGSAKLTSRDFFALLPGVILLFEAHKAAPKAIAQVTRFVEQVEELTARLVNALIDRPDVRLGHR